MRIERGVDGKRDIVFSRPERRINCTNSVLTTKISGMMIQNIFVVELEFFESFAVFSDGDFAVGFEKEVGIIFYLAREGNGIKENVFNLGSDRKIFNTRFNFGIFGVGNS